MICSSLSTKTAKQKIQTEIGDDDCGSDDSESDRSGDELENLQQLEHFLKSSRAFESFRTKLKAFVYPSEKQTEQTKVVFQLEEAEKARQEDATSETKLPSPARQTLDVPSLAFYRPFDKMMALLSAALRGGRPPVPRGKTRIEWQCVSLNQEHFLSQN